MWNPFKRTRNERVDDFKIIQDVDSQTREICDRVVEFYRKNH